MSLLNHFEVGSACKEFERKGFFECSVFSSISHNNKSFSNLTTHHKVNKYENSQVFLIIIRVFQI